MRWEAFCAALGHRFGAEPLQPRLYPLDPPPENPQELARAAKELLQNPVFRLAMDRVQQGIIKTWRHSALGSSDQREAAYRLHAAVEELRAELARMSTGG